MVLGCYIFVQSPSMVLGYFSALQFSSNIELLDARGGVASQIIISIDYQALYLFHWNFGVVSCIW